MAGKKKSVKEPVSEVVAPVAATNTPEPATSEEKKPDPELAPTPKVPDRPQSPISHKEARMLRAKRLRTPTAKNR